MSKDKDKAASHRAFRPVAVPLVTMDPYISCWSTADRLTDDWPRHWTGQPHSMCGLIRVDGRCLKFMGGPMALKDAARQASVEVRPTQTIYQFDCASVKLCLTFTTPLLCDDLEAMGRPITYVTFDLRSADGKPHVVELYFDISAQWAVNHPGQDVVWGRRDAADQHVLWLGAKNPDPLGKSGDDLRIDWGRLYLALPKTAKTSPSWWNSAISQALDSRRAFIARGMLDARDEASMPAPADSFGGPVLAASFGPETLTAPRQCSLTIAYDDEYSIEYFHQPLRPWWRRDGKGIDWLLAGAHRDRSALLERCRKFDRRLLSDARRVGGGRYADLVGLAYRQAIAAHKLVASPEGKPWFFSKENNSNGCIATVDVTYPSSPLFLLYNPDLVKGMIEPIFEYCSSNRWPHPFAAHDLGTYPKANGQVYGVGDPQGQMPVEESGNLIILVAAIALREGTADFARRWWPLLTQWAQYLRSKGLDPEDQLCTDDFAGRLSRNANLSVKAIVALGCYGKLAAMLGHRDAAGEYTQLAKAFALSWEALANDGDHYRLVFDRPETWSQKYNLIWDKVLHLGLFGPGIAAAEIAYYLQKQNKFGLPLDCRKDYTKSDWVLWSACLAESRQDFQELVEPIWRYAHQSTTRVPLSDWHDTKTGRYIGFKARSVVGGYFMKMLMDKMARRK